MAKTPCARSVDRGPSPSQEEFCNNTALFQVVVTFNGHRYLVDLCEQHKAEHDDAAARRRQARKDANKKARNAFEQRHPKLVS
jgi:hypothetical protein